jgi:uncharacterized protein (TIGR00290 family)
MNNKSVFNWSGGKDSSLALWKVMKEEKYEVKRLLTSVNAAHNRVSMHGVRRELLEMQAAAIGIPLTTIELPEQPGMEEYEQAMMKTVNELKSMGIRYSIFGDIFLEDLKLYRENKLKQVGIECVFPLWKIDTGELMKEFLAAGFKAIVVCVNEKYLDKSFCGRMIDASFVKDLPAGVDVCGENGEYHSYVFEGPIFSKPIPIVKGEIVYRQYAAPVTAGDTAMDQASPYGFYFCDLLPVQ